MTPFHIIFVKYFLIFICFLSSSSPPRPHSSSFKRIYFDLLTPNVTNNNNNEPILSSNYDCKLDFLRFGWGVGGGVSANPLLASAQTLPELPRFTTEDGIFTGLPLPSTPAPPPPKEFGIKVKEAFASYTFFEITWKRKYDIEKVRIHIKGLPPSNLRSRLVFFSVYPIHFRLGNFQSGFILPYDLKLLY